MDKFFIQWQQHMKRLSNAEGVTLIELLVVVVILAIIAAVAIPSVMGSINSAKLNTDKQNAQIIADAINRLSADEQMNGASGLSLTTGALSTASGSATLSGTNLYGGSTSVNLDTALTTQTKGTNGNIGPYISGSLPTPQDPTGTEQSFSIVQVSAGSSPGGNASASVTVGGTTYYVID